MVLRWIEKDDLGCNSPPVGMRQGNPALWIRVRNRLNTTHIKMPQTQ